LAVQLGIAQRVRFAGQLPNDELLHWYSAADVLVLASSREGWPNVLLESMACGTPVVATKVAGIPEIVTEAVAGRLVANRDAASFAAEIEELLEHPPAREKVRGYAEKFGWQSTTDAQIALFEKIVLHVRERSHA
jgi:teichuronic acid biosynthesis glycosyltransferase TuaC